MEKENVASAVGGMLAALAIYGVVSKAHEMYQRYRKLEGKLHFMENEMGGIDRAVEFAQFHSANIGDLNLLGRILHCADRWLLDRYRAKYPKSP